MRWSSLEEVVPADLFYSALCLADVNLMFGRRSERRQRRGLQIWHHLREPAWINGHIGTLAHTRCGRPADASGHALQHVWGSVLEHVLL